MTPFALDHGPIRRSLLVALGFAALVATSACTSTTFDEVRDGYRIQLAPEVVADLDLEEISHLSLLDSERGQSTIEGRLRQGRDGFYVFESQSRLAFTPTTRTEIVLSSSDIQCPPGSPCSCYPPEFFEGVTGAVCLCAGTVYCLPGDPCVCL